MFHVLHYRQNKHQEKLIEKAISVYSISLLYCANKQRFWRIVQTIIEKKHKPEDESYLSSE